MEAADITVSVDIEATNRCNASCSFCPRDQTPHQGLMSVETFDRSLERAIEVRDALEVVGSKIGVSICGLGEPLLNKHTPAWVRQVRQAGLACSMSSNGALLDERRATELLDAGLQNIFLNVGDLEDSYEEVYRLPFGKTLANVERFIELARDTSCAVHLVLVDHRRDPEHLARLRSFWEERGVSHFVEYGIINRGGSLFVEEMQFLDGGERDQAQALLDEAGGDAFCGVPFGFLFIGYDGQYYLCCSDWKKEAPLGSVHERSFLDVLEAKYAHTTTREPVCRSCNHDPLNMVADEVRAEAQGVVAAGTARAMAVEQVGVSSDVRRWIELLRPGCTASPPPVPTAEPGRRLIPVRAD